METESPGESGDLDLGSNSADILGREREVTGLTDGLDVECEGKRGAWGSSGVLILNDYMMVCSTDCERLGREKLQGGGARNQKFFVQVKTKLSRNF